MKSFKILVEKRLKELWEEVQHNDALCDKTLSELVHLHDGVKTLEVLEKYVENSKKEDLESMIRKLKYKSPTDVAKGMHWDKKDTTAVAQSLGIVFEHITEEEWWSIMNISFVMFGHLASSISMSEKPEFFAHLSKEMIFKESEFTPSEKIIRLYEHLV